MKTSRTLTYFSVIEFGGHKVLDYSRYLCKRTCVDYLGPVENNRISVILVMILIGKVSLELK
jgi:hypothetical protein